MKQIGKLRLCAAVDPAVLSAKTDLHHRADGAQRGHQLLFAAVYAALCHQRCNKRGALPLADRIYVADAGGKHPVQVH